MRAFPRPGAYRNVAGTCLVLMLCVGCGGTGELSGNVSYKGKPLKGGAVTFVEKETGRSYPSMIGPDGGYKIPQIPTGDYKVCVDTSFLKDDSSSASSSMGSRMSGPQKKNVPPPVQEDKEKDKGNSASHQDAAAQSGYNPGNASMSAAKKANMERYVQIPPDYRKPETTRKEYTVSGGKVVWNVELD